MIAQRINFRIRDSIRNSPDCFAEEGGVVGDVLGLFGEGLDNVEVVLADEEGLDDCAEGEELEGRGGWHFGNLCRCSL